MDFLLSDDRGYNNFVRSMSNITKSRLNNSLIIGILIFGPLLLCGGFGDIKQTKFFILYIALFVVSFIFAWPLSILVYIIGWIHINYIFTKYEKIAKIALIKASSEESFNSFAAKGILYFRIFNAKDDALNSLQNALKYEWGDPQLVFLCARHLLKRNEYKLAYKYLKQVIEQPPNQKALLQSNKLLKKFGANYQD
jgi:tetratricopeptide (TPR) repeat protein